MAKISRVALRQHLVTNWANSWLFRAIDTRISRHFRTRLHNQSFTILCSNCIGGIIYHRLGLPFLSPTINLFMSQPDFVEFCIHLEYYLSKELQFIDTDIGYPVAELAGNGKDIKTILLNFNHYKTAEDANSKWESRKRRINLDNLYIVLYKLDGLTIDHLRSLEEVVCKNKVVLTSVPLPEITWSYYIKPNYHEKWPMSYLGKDIFGMRRFEKKFDFVAFLNQQ